MSRVSRANSVDLRRLTCAAPRGGSSARCAPLLFLGLSPLLLTFCASTQPVDHRDRFPLDPRESLAGPFPEGVSRGWSRMLAGGATAAEAAFRPAPSPTPPPPPPIPPAQPPRRGRPGPVSRPAGASTGGLGPLPASAPRGRAAGVSHGGVRRGACSGRRCSERLRALSTCARAHWRPSRSL